MLLPRVVMAALAVRQAADILPYDYCQPQCPGCKTNIIDFDSATSCMVGSQFLTNCGACQQCIITYSFQNSSLTQLSELESTLENQINRCENTNASGAVSALQSQASRLIQFGASLTAAAGASKTTGPVTAIAVVTDTPNESASFSSLLATATWAAAYSSGMASVSAASASSAAAAAAANRTSTSVANPAALTSSPSSEETKPSRPGPALNKTWIAGPVLGSILGVSTVLVVIYCTRRKQKREEWELGVVQPKEFEDDDLSPTDPGKPQLHSECVSPRELENSEIVLPAELPALEPVGMELLTPRDVTSYPEKEWPLPISPLPALFAEAEIRDERAGKSESPKHETFYHP